MTRLDRRANLFNLKSVIMKTNSTLLFYLKKPNYVKGVLPIYLRITVDGKRAELCTSRECEPELWNTKAGHMAGTKEEAKTMNTEEVKIEMKFDKNSLIYIRNYYI